MGWSAVLRLLGLGVSLFTPPLSAGPRAQQPGLPPDIEAGLLLWRIEHGPSWEVVLDGETQVGRLLCNGRDDPGDFDPQSDSDWFLLARALLMDAHGVLRIDDDTLVNDRVLMLPLGIVGTSDKYTVRFRQVVSNVPVRGGWVNLLFDTEANILALDSDALPDLSGFDVDATVTSATASTVATSSFAQDTGLQPTSVGTPVLAVFKRVVEGHRSGVLVWEVETLAETSGGTIAYLYRIAAQPPANVVQREDLVLEAFQQPQQMITGKVEAYVVVHPEWKPDPRDGTFLELRPMAYMYLRNDATNSILTTTDANGEFGFAAPLGGSIRVRMDFKGPYSNTCNAPDPPNDGICTNCNQNYRTVVTLSAGINKIVMRPITYPADDAVTSASDEEVVAQANVLYHVNRARDWIHSLNPLDLTFDQGKPYTLRPNRDACDSAALGQCPSPSGFVPRIWFSKHTGEEPTVCQNLAFSTIIWHELGHVMNNLYGSGNHVGSGFGEGCADVWTLYQADYHIVGNGVSRRRFGTNTTQFCGECDRGFPPPEGCTDCQGCHGGAHADGEVLMGALWKVRDELKLFLHESLGATTADALFLAWMNAFDTSRILSVIEYQWLCLDSPDGILSNAPHLIPIDSGIIKTGIPRFPDAANPIPMRWERLRRIPQ